MESKNVDQYLSSKKVIESMLLRGLISCEDFKKADSYLAKKYCIKADSIYRSNHLLFSGKRVIYSTAKKEVQNGKNNS